VALAALAEKWRMTEIGSYTHGGDVDRAAREAGIPVERLLDFSANVNPMGLPARAAERLAREARDPRIVSHYPNPEAPELRVLLSRQLDVPGECIAIGAGADSLIHAAVRALRPKRCLIPMPAFSEYERACRAYGCEVVPIPLTPEWSLDRQSLQVAEAGDLIVFNNPHNPTGACASRAEMLDRIETMRASGCFVLADEAFIDYAPQAAITSEAATLPGVIAIRSLTKFFGCPGLRVGYAVAAPETARSLAAQLPAWPVTALAQNALAEALRDVDYARAAIERNQQARSQLSSALVRLGVHVFPASANFLFLRLPDCLPALHVRDQLIREHAIVVRECDSFAGIERGRFLRVAVRQENENARLIAALASVFGGSSCQQNRP
jgi:threonine-phosphate decarboxylase